MYEDVLDVLLYLFEHYSEDDALSATDPESVRGELELAGFAESVVDKAFIWLEGLVAPGEAPPRVGQARGAMRIFAAEESARIDVSARGFIYFLEQTGMLDPVRRELVIDRAMALDTEEVDLAQLKWVVQLVLSNLPGEAGEESQLEVLMLEESVGLLH